jgi:holo-[acyl-carrier protein] synthase
MIFGIGTDIVQVLRLQRSIERFGERFARRILAESEFEDYRRHSRPANFLARRFAAKEAAAKAMGTGISGGIALGQISVTHESSGKPTLMFTGHALEYTRTHRIRATHISIADEADYAVAFVVFESM